MAMPIPVAMLVTTESGKEQLRHNDCSDSVLARSSAVGAWDAQHGPDPEKSEQ